MSLGSEFSVILSYNVSIQKVSLLNIEMIARNIFSDSSPIIFPSEQNTDYNSYAEIRDFIPIQVFRLIRCVL